MFYYKKFNINHFEEVDSTNIKAIEIARSKFDSDYSVVIADKQSAGRGRLNRVWESPCGNLYFSLILQNSTLDKLFLEKINQIGMLSILAMQQAIIELSTHHNLASKNILIKWPHDLLINGKKFSGMLMESEINQDICKFLVIGIGININSYPSHIKRLNFPATDLFSENIILDKMDILYKFLDKFDSFLTNFLQFGFENIRKLWLKNSFQLNQEITIKINDDNIINGIFSDIDDNGNILLLSNGVIHKISYGDIGF